MGEIQYNKAARIIDHFIDEIITNFCGSTEQCNIKLNNSSSSLPVIDYINNKIMKKDTTWITHGSWIEPKKSDMKLISKNLNDLSEIGLIEKIKGKWYLLNIYKHLDWTKIQELNTDDIIEMLHNNKNPNNTYWNLVYGIIQLILPEASKTITQESFITYLLRYNQGNVESTTPDSISTSTENQDTPSVTNEYAESVVIFIKCLYWYFRKFIVDTLIDSIKTQNDVKAMSVGSTNLSSDYDVTLYGKYKNIGNVINQFDDMFYVIFKDTSGKIFDTNLYGASFIDVARTSNLFDESKCGKNDNISFAYTKKSNNEIQIQHTFAFVKILMRIDYIANFDEMFYSKLMADILSKCKKSLMTEYANKLILVQESNYNKYKESIVNFGKYQDIMKQNNVTDETLIMNTYISYINYNGFETYFTRGAFLDVVVRQMCNNNSKLKLDLHDYLDSLMENVAELIVHSHKKKYINRAKYALEKLKGSIQPSSFNELSDFLIDIEKIQDECSNDIFNCMGYLFIELCVKCSCLIGKIIIDYTGKLTKEMFKPLDIIIQ